jgi:EAL domain-containing protein (putative c-di-GMP-specific phosphodiesterase class I)/DNA-binding NarL/FixJ family response regulator
MGSFTDFQKLHVMVVEDSALQRQYAMDLLFKLGLKNIVAAADGRQALELLDQLDKPIQILVCDLEMPDIDGIELIRRIALTGLRPAVIMASTHEELQNTVQKMVVAYELVFLGALEKPLVAETLADLLQSYFTLQTRRQKNQSGVPEFTREDLWHALENKQFYCDVQPKVTLSTGLLKGVECLARWQHPEYGVISPARFIPLAENSDIIEPLTLYLIEYSLEYLQQWLDRGLNLSAAVNIPPRILHNPSLIDGIVDVCERKSIPPSHVMLEVTESAIMENLAQALGSLARLRIRGFGLSCDDYGTGYSSLQQLSQVPFSELKIDQSLVNGVATNRALQVILDSALGMARRLGITAVAEGVETEDDWHFLRQSGCEIAQGYLIGRPMPASQLIDWIRESRSYLRLLTR